MISKVEPGPEYKFKPHLTGKQRDLDRDKKANYRALRTSSIRKELKQEAFALGRMYSHFRLD